MIRQNIIDITGNTYETTYFKADGTSQSGGFKYRDFSNLQINTNIANTYKWGFVNGSVSWNRFLCLPDPIDCSNWDKLVVKYLYYYDGGQYPNGTISLAKNTTPGTYYVWPADAYQSITVGGTQYTDTYYRNLLGDSSWTLNKAIENLDNGAWTYLEFDLSDLVQFYFYVGCNCGYLYIADVYLMNSNTEEKEFLLKSGSNLYTIKDGALVSLGDVEIQADLFLKNAFSQSEMNVELIKKLVNPSIYRWNPTEYRTMSALITAQPFPQTIITNDIDISDKTITGIEKVTAEYTGDPHVACSFDGGTTWKLYNGTAWVVLSETETGMTMETLLAITTESWTQILQGLASFKMRFTLANKEDTVTNIVINFTN